MDTTSNIYNILKISFCVFIAVLCVSATEVAHAKTIESNYTYIDSSRLDFFENIFLRSDYNSYLLASEIVTSGYNSYTTYYFCLSNEIIDTSDVLNSTLNCEELYSYNRDVSNNYVITKLSDNELVVNNSIYYSNNISTKDIDLKSYLLVISIGVFCIFFLIILFRIFR